MVVFTNIMGCLFASTFLLLVGFLLMFGVELAGEKVAPGITSSLAERTRQVRDMAMRPWVMVSIIGVVAVVLFLLTGDEMGRWAMDVVKSGGPGPALQ